MMALCEGCAAPPDAAVLVLYGALAFPFVASFTAGWLFCVLMAWLAARSSRR